MNKTTNSFWVTEQDGEIRIGYEDYGVSLFGDCDVEKSYYLCKENSQKFIDALKKEYCGSLEKMIEAAFGKKFDDHAFREFCKNNGIEYSSFVWVD